MNGTADSSPGYDASASPPTFEEVIDDLPPSAKLSLKVLEAEGPLTQQDLAAATRLSKRTVRDATKRLVSVGVVEERPHVMDARKSVYRVHPDTDSTS
jgi:DNA-binding MarR family transcriptional regulator